MNQDQACSDPSDLDAQIDRLIGQELADADRRALLLRLEATPDGWRRCAMAFLEDQAWRSALATLAPSTTASTPVYSPLILKPHPVRAQRGIRLALAAGLVAVALGVSFWAGATVAERSEPLVAQNATVASPPAPPLAPAPRGASDDEVPPGQPLGWVGLLQQDEGRDVVQPVPVLAATPANVAWVENQPPTIPAYVRTQLERQGYQIAENHRLVDLNLQDGRRLAIPVDEVEVDYVGRIPL